MSSFIDELQRVLRWYGDRYGQEAVAALIQGEIPIDDIQDETARAVAIEQNLRMSWNIYLDITRVQERDMALWMEKVSPPPNREIDFDRMEFTRAFTPAEAKRCKRVRKGVYDIPLEKSSGYPAQSLIRKFNDYNQVLASYYGWYHG